MNIKLTFCGNGLLLSMLLPLVLLSGCQSIGKQNKTLFVPTKLPATHRYALPANTTEIRVQVASDTHLSGLLYRSPSSKGLIVYFQGNAKNLQNFLDHHFMVTGWGYDVLVTDYRGFGTSEGTLRGQDQLYADAEKVYDYALGLGYSPERIILYGYSLGTGLATHLAGVRKAKALVLESPYTSISEIPWIGNKAPAYALNSKAKARSVHIPTLVVHGQLDKVIPPDHAQQLYESLASTQKQLHIMKAGGHGDFRGTAEYQQLVTGFLRDQLSSAPKTID